MNKKEKRLKELKDSKFIFISMDDKYINYEDTQGYRYHKSIYDKSKLNTNHKYNKNNIYAIYNIKHLLELSHTNTILVEDSFNGGQSLITFKCGSCGKEFKSLIGNFVKYKYKVCGECTHKLQDTKLQEYDNIKKEVESYGYELLSEKWCGNHTRINIKDSDGYKGRVKLETLRDGNSFSKYSKYNPYTLDNIRLFCKLKGYTCGIPDQIFKGWDYPLKVKCECGNIYQVNLEK
jgi:hypothetical protein